MKDNKSMIRMNIRSAVLYVESQINKGNFAMFVNTEFGKIMFEGNTNSRDVDPIHPAVVVPWEQAPRTFWVLQNKEKDADIYVSVDIYEEEAEDHMSIIEGFVRSLLMMSGFSNPRDQVVFALVLSFMDNYDEKKILISRLADDYMHCHMNKFVRQCDSVNVVVTEMFQQKVDAARMVMNMANLIFDQYVATSKIDADAFNDNFCKEVYAMFLYMQLHNERKIDGIKQNIVEFFNTGSLTQNTNAVNK